MRILLINPPWVIGRSIWQNIAAVMPPLGLAQMAACLRRSGHQVAILDAHAERVDLGQFAGRVEQLGQFDLVGITATTALIHNALELARMTRRTLPTAKIVLGGVHPTVLPEEVLAETAVDLVVRGEGELTIQEIADGKCIEQIDGVSFRSGGGVKHNPDRELIEDLDSLPMPAYDLLPMDRYHPAVGAAKRLPAASMLATRGCPGRCTFCYRLFGSKLRSRSGLKIAQEVKHLQDNYGVREVCFYDDTFTAFKGELRRFCESLSVLNIDLTWSCFSRVDTVDEDLLVTMARAGCHQIMFGIESANEQVLQNIGKSADTAKAARAVRLTRKVGIDVRATFMLGNPGETEETMKETLAFAMRLGPEIALFNITTPFPGTEMFDWAEEHGYLTTKDWREYHFGNAVMELPTISAEAVRRFYRRVHRRFFLRPRYLARRVAKLRSLVDFTDAYRAVRAVAHV